MHRSQPGGEIIGGQDIGGFVDQVAGEKHALGQGGHGCRLFGHSFGVIGHDGDTAQRVDGGGFVGGKVIGPQHQPKGHVRRPRHAARQHQQIARPAMPRNRSTRLARLVLTAFARQFHHQQRLGGQTCGKGNLEHLPGFRLGKSRACHKAVKGFAGQAVNLATGQIRLSIRVQKYRHPARNSRQPRQIIGFELNLHKVGHDISFDLAALSGMNNS